MCYNYSLDVLGVNVHAAGNDDVFVSPQVVQVAILVHFTGVPGAKILSFHGLVGEGGALVVTAEAHRCLTRDLPHFPGKGDSPAIAKYPEIDSRCRPPYRFQSGVWGGAIQVGCDSDFGGSIALMEFAVEP